LLNTQNKTAEIAKSATDPTAAIITIGTADSERDTVVGAASPPAEGRVGPPKHGEAADREAVP
jgi:hypothetical protein